ncbi:hypothetical protein BHS05_33325 [Myxococcus xanthus]|uniref:Uncharacterized protein n=1 Tax=Myxococcus xanthus TaxID=34 RepID=A0AAE6G6K0_MYXXA|nr:hypothetical protein BHS09_33465 [Myxococcus xanthus]QDE78784.1 hypothetical protein BHS08_33485 [Myxococcus xanthus]QDF00330.1 hypothetical protein BHS05_33325 [Myxococcus xanthus]QDF08106.1 hypothetical protein BHS04_33590 [Myxococcus xanthus]
MGVVEEPVHGGAGHEWVAKEGRPLFDGAVGGDDGAAALVALADHLVEVHRLVLSQAAQAEVIDDEQVGRGEAQEALVVAAFAACGAQLHEHFVGADVEGAEARAAGAVAEGLGQVGLADAGGADDEDVVVALQEGAGAQFQHLGLGDAGVEVEVEVLEGAGVLEGGTAHALGELLGVATFHLVAQQAVEEFGVGEVVVHGLLGAHLEGLEGAGQAQLLEYGNQLVSGTQFQTPGARRGGEAARPRCVRNAAEAGRTSPGRRVPGAAAASRGLGAEDS